MKVVLASKNPHKLIEMQAILQHLGMEVVMESEVGVDVDVEETGTTFEENAMLKAEAVMKASGMPAIADDSGLVVDALDGAPGVYSARYGGDLCADDAARTAYLLKNMEQIPDGKRTARFVSVIALARPDGSTVLARGEAEGHILRETLGHGGFGYDPVFYSPEAGCTFAQLTAEQKNSISHRAHALQAFSEKIKKENNHVDK